MQIVTTETKQWKETGLPSPELLKALEYTNRMLGFKTTLAVPSEQFLTNGLLENLFSLVFHKPMIKNN